MQSRTPLTRMLTVGLSAAGGDWRRDGGSGGSGDRRDGAAAVGGGGRGGGGGAGGGRARPAVGCLRRRRLPPAAHQWSRSVVQRRCLGNVHATQFSTVLRNDGVNFRWSDNRTCRGGSRPPKYLVCFLAVRYLYFRKRWPYFNIL